MKTIPFVPACQNMAEIQKLTVLITDFIHPEMIVLFGRYAGMPLYDIRGGYELLILTEAQPSVSVKELTGYLATHFPLQERKEPNIALHLLTVGFVHHRSSQSYFLYTIRKEGILLYKNESCKLRDVVYYKPVRSYRQAEGYSDQCLAHHQVEIGNKQGAHEGCHQHTGKNGDTERNPARSSRSG